MSDRETKVIVTPLDKHNVVLNLWITGREKRELRNVFLENIKIGGSNPESIETSSEILTKAENKAIEIVISSVNEKNDNILDFILDMKMKDYEFVINEVNKITKDEDFLE